MNILDLLELDATASEPQLVERAREKQRYFANLAKTAPTRMLADVYARRLAEIETFLAARGQDGAAPDRARPAERPAASPRAAAAGMECYLEAVGGPAPRRIPLHTGLNIIGREPRQMGNPIVLDDNFVSKNHAVIEVVPGPPPSVHVFDIGETGAKPSTNGVFVGDAPGRITGRVALSGGERLRFGDCRFVFHLSAGSAPAPRAAAAASDDEFNRTVIIKAPYK